MRGLQGQAPKAPAPPRYALRILMCLAVTVFPSVALQHARDPKIKISVLEELNQDSLESEPSHAFSSSPSSGNTSTTKLSSSLSPGGNTSASDSPKDSKHPAGQDHTKSQRKLPDGYVLGPWVSPAEVPSDLLLTNMSFLPNVTHEGDPGNFTGQAGNDLRERLEFITSPQCSLKRSIRPKVFEAGFGATVSSVIKPVMHALKYGYCVRNPGPFELYTNETFAESGQESEWDVFFQPLAKHHLWQDPMYGPEGVEFWMNYPLVQQHWTMKSRENKAVRENLREAWMQHRFVKNLGENGSPDDLGGVEGLFLKDMSVQTRFCHGSAEYKAFSKQKYGNMSLEDLRGSSDAIVNQDILNIMAQRNLCDKEKYLQNLLNAHASKHKGGLEANGNMTLEDLREFSDASVEKYPQNLINAHASKQQGKLEAIEDPHPACAQWFEVQTLSASEDEYAFEPSTAQICSQLYSWKKSGNDTLPAGMEDKGLFYTVAFISARMTRLNSDLKRQVEEAKKNMSWPAGERIIGLHFRAGDSCLERHGDHGRKCEAFDVYMKQVDRISEKYKIKNVYLATDSDTVVRQLHNYPNYTFFYDRSVDRGGNRNKQNIEMVLMGRLIDGYEEGVNVMKAVSLLSETHAFVGKFSSNIDRLAYQIMFGKYGVYRPFISMDAPWCFDFAELSGYNSGRDSAFYC